MRTFLSLKTCLLSALLLCVNSIAASKIISVSDFGLKPDSRINAVPFIQKAIDACKQHPGSTLVFPKGRYDFWAQHAIEKDYYETGRRPPSLQFSADTVCLKHHTHTKADIQAAA